jgi:hypothetical protein
MIALPSSNAQSTPFVKPDEDLLPPAAEVIRSGKTLCVPSKSMVKNYISDPQNPPPGIFALTSFRLL